MVMTPSGAGPERGLFPHPEMLEKFILDRMEFSKIRFTVDRMALFVLWPLPKYFSGHTPRHHVSNAATELILTWEVVTGT